LIVLLTVNSKEWLRHTLSLGGHIAHFNTTQGPIAVHQFNLSSAPKVNAKAMTQKICFFISLRKLEYQKDILVSASDLLRG